MPRTTKKDQAVLSDTLSTTLRTLTTLYETHILPHLPPALQDLSYTLLNALDHALPFLTQTISLLSSLMSGASTSDGSGLLSLGILLVTAYVGLRLANYIRKTIIGWIMLGVKMGMVLGLVQVGLYVNQYGWERTLRDAGWIGGIVWGLGQEVWEGMQGNMQQGSRQGQGRTPRGMRGRGDAGGGRNLRSGNRW